MRIPQNKKKAVVTMNSSLKNAAKAVSVAKINTKGPAIGKATLKLQREGHWTASVKCLNGDPRRNLETTIAAGTTYADGTRLPEAGDVAVILPDGLLIDVSAIYPWTSRQDPASRRGGHGKGQIKEGAQDPGRTGPPVPISWPHILTNWINGTVVESLIVGSDTFGQIFYPGDAVFFHYIVNERTEDVLKVIIKSEGSCLDLGVAHIVTDRPSDVSDK